MGQLWSKTSEYTINCCKITVNKTRSTEFEKGIIRWLMGQIRPKTWKYIVKFCREDDRNSRRIGFHKKKNNCPLWQQ